MRSSLLFLSFIMAAMRAASGQSNTTELKPIIAELGKSADLSCHHPDTNQTILSVVWKVGVNSIVTMGNGQQKFQGSYKGKAQLNDTTLNLTLLDVEFADAGTYTCTVTTFDGSVSYSEVLEVLAVPSVSTKVFPISESDNASTEKKKVAECIAAGGSQPFTMKWVTVPQQDLVINNNFRTDSTDPANDQLVDAVLPLTLVPDAARNNGRRFSCVVVDAFGKQIVKDAILSVTASPEISAFPTNDGGVINMKIGETDDFICSVFGEPSPSVAWFKGSTKVSEGYSSAILSIDSANYDSAGVFTCNGENDIGSVERSFRIEVNGSPVISSNGGMDNSTEEVIVGQESELFGLSCEASSLPVAEFLWKVEGLNTSDVIVEYAEVSEDMITVSSVNMSADTFLGKTIRVTCVAYNQLGSSRKDFLVTGEEVKQGSTGLVVGVIIAIIIVLALVFFIVYFTLNCRRKQQADITEASAETGCCTCFTGMCKTKKDAVDNSNPAPEAEQTKEPLEEGTKEEKQKLTEAEQQPAEKEKESTSSDDESTKEADAPKSKKPLCIPFPSHCCVGNKKQLKEEDSVEDEAGNPPAEESKENEVKTVDSDSGKGDTLEKVIEEPAK